MKKGFTVEELENLQKKTEKLILNLQRRRDVKEIEAKSRAKYREAEYFSTDLPEVSVAAKNLLSNLDTLKEGIKEMLKNKKATPNYIQPSEGYKNTISRLERNYSQFEKMANQHSVAQEIWAFLKDLLTLAIPSASRNTNYLETQHVALQIKNDLKNILPSEDEQENKNDLHTGRNPTKP